MASLLTIKLNKSPGTSWGIRLQGGKDFASPLCIQKVNSGSVAEKSGLQASDAVVSINGHDVFSLRHKEAQDLIVKAGNNFDMVVQRGMQTWRPAVTPLQEVQRNPEGVPVATKTSLAATPQKPIRCIGSNYNCVPRPFPGSASLKTTNLSVPTASANGRPTSPDSRGDVRSTVSSPAFSNGYHSPSSIPTNDSSTSDIAAVPKQIVNAQFNTPINIYSEDAIAETLSAQAEILSKGVVGINFKKYDKEEKIRTDSPTYRLLHGEEDEPSPRKSRPNPVQSDSGSHLPFQHDPTEHQPAHHQPGSKAPQPTQSYPHAGHVPHAAAPGTEGLQPGENICAGCERLITGVFVRVKNKNLHADCFKCATCGSSLKNVGYYNINEKLYCDIHAKQAVRQHPPAPGMVPVTVQPGSAPPAGAMTSPQARAVKAPFQSKIPSAGFQSPAPVSAPFKPPAGGVKLPTATFTLSSPAPYKRVPVAPAPFSAPAPSPIHKVAPPAHAPVVAPSFHSSANPQNFGAPAGDLNVRAHIPKKGQSFEWPPRRAVREDDEEAHPPAWAPCGEIPSVPKPIKPAGPPPKTPPLLPTPPPPKDYDVMVMKSSTPTNIQVGKTSQPSTASKSHPLSVIKSKPAEIKQIPSQGPPPPLSSRFPKPAPSYIIFGGSNQVAAPTHNDAGKAKPLSSSKSPSSGILKKASTNRSMISPPKLVPVTLAMPVVKFDTTPLQLSDPNIKPNIPKHAPIPVVSALKTNTEPIIGFKPVSAPAPPLKKVAPSGVHSVKHPGAPHPPAPIPVKSSLPASVPASAENVTPKPVPSNPSNLADAAPAPAQISSIGSNFMPKPTPPPGGIAFPKLGGSARGFQAPGQRSAPRRGRGIMNPASASRIPICAACQRQIRGPFVSALGKTWCPDHFICATETCRRPIIEMGFVEEQGKLYCEVCYESYLAPICGKCDKRVKGDCLNAVGKQFHPECFCCAYCGKVFGSGAFYLEDGLPYCETDWNDLFTTKCVGCNFPIEAGDRWVEALNNNYHSQCFKCSKCHKNLEGQSFFAKGGKPFCKAHAQRGFQA